MKQKASYYIYDTFLFWAYSHIPLLRTMALSRSLTEKRSTIGLLPDQLTLSP